MTGGLDELVRKAKVVVVLGSGGVGKTTSAITLAVMGALAGRRVGLLSIDPAKRLAAAMGIPLSSQLAKVPLPTAAGELHAAMLDQKAVFDEMVRRFSPNEKVRAKILANSIYQAASTKLGGPIEYMALAKLEQMAGQYDLIVVDTPPDTHALDFLIRPDILGGFMDRRVISWLIKPWLLARRFGAERFLGLSEKLIGGIASITGIKMMQMLADFIVMMEDVIRGFNEAGKKVSVMLKQPSTQFFIVTAPQGASVRSSENIMRLLRAKGFPLKALLVNRYLPASLARGIDYYEGHREELTALEPGMGMLRKKAEVTRQFVQRLRHLTHEHFGTSLPIYVVEEQGHLIHSLDAVLSLAGIFKNAKALP